MATTSDLGKNESQFSTPNSGDTAQPVSHVAPRKIGIISYLRYYGTFVVAALCFLIMGTPAIPAGHFLRRWFGIKDFIFPFGRLGAKLYLATAGARLHISGLENLDARQPYVFVANHQSNLDPPMIVTYLDRNTSFLVKKELFRIPLFAQGIRQVDMVPVDRSNREAARASAELATARLKGGRSFVGFPEGTRSVDGRLKEFKKGLFHMALAAGVPVVPVVVNDTRLVMRKGTNYCLPGEVSMEVLPPISTDGYTEENLEELIARVRNEFLPRVRTD